MVFEEQQRNQTMEQVASAMMTAARTAPKGKGMDNLVIAWADESDRQQIAGEMKRMVDRGEAAPFFIRDADNLLNSEGLVLMGTKIRSLGVTNCGLCGFKDCAEKTRHPQHPCSFNTGDLGIALGSACATASDFRVDNRIMFSIGKAVVKLGLLGEEAKIVYGIPMSCKGKSPFFDR